MINPFDIFDLPVSFNIDQNLLSQRYLAQQKALHPDNFVTADQAEQRQAIQQSAIINDALKILKDPVLRAESIIALHTGEQTDIEQKSNHDVAFLMQQLQWREELAEIENRKSETDLAAFSKRIQVETQQILTALSQSLAQQEWQQAEQLCDRLRFFKKLQDEIERVEDVIFDF